MYDDTWVKVVKVLTHGIIKMNMRNSVFVLPILF